MCPTISPHFSFQDVFSGRCSPPKLTSSVLCDLSLAGERQHLFNNRNLLILILAWSSVRRCEPMRFISVLAAGTARDVRHTTMTIPRAARMVECYSKLTEKQGSMLSLRPCGIGSKLADVSSKSVSSESPATPPAPALLAAVELPRRHSILNKPPLHPRTSIATLGP